MVWDAASPVLRDGKSDFAIFDSFVIDCGQVWVNYVASAPLQNVTHQLRFPLVISLMFLAVALGTELCRARLSVFKADRCKWRDIVRAVDDNDTGILQCKSVSKIPVVKTIATEK